MDTNVIAASSSPSAADVAPADAGLYCPRCDYNLTGIESPRCPECGDSVDWDAVHAAARARSRRRGPPWERWPWYLAPVSFVVTVLQVACAPWLLARQLPDRPRLWPGLLFVGLCGLCGWLCVRHFVMSDYVVYTWWIGTAVYATLQVLAFATWLPLARVRWPWRYWFAATCYTSYPLLLPVLIEVRGRAAFLKHVFPSGGFPSVIPPCFWPPYCSVWPFDRWGLRSTGSFDGLTTVTFYGWAVGLLVIATTRTRRQGRWRLLGLPLLILALACTASYVGLSIGPIILGPGPGPGLW